MSHSFETPWTIALQTPLSMGFPKQEYWSGLPFSSPGNLPDPRIKPAGRFFIAESPGKPQCSVLERKKPPWFFCCTFYGGEKTKILKYMWNRFQWFSGELLLFKKSHYSSFSFTDFWGRSDNFLIFCRI